MTTEQKPKTRTTEPALTSPDNTINSADFQDLYRVVQQMDGRVSELEESNGALETKNSHLEGKVIELRQMVVQLTGSVTDMKDTLKNFDEVEAAIANLHEEDVELADEIDEVLGLTQQNRRNAEHRIASVMSRVSALEDYLSDDESGPVDAVQLVSDSACELEHLAALPEDIRDVKIDGKPVARAVVVWENFDDWAEYSPHGYIVKSGQLRKYLQAALDESIDWSPLYRVMAAFKQNTHPDYEFIDTETTGKALIKMHEGVSIPEMDIVSRENF